MKKALVVGINYTGTSNVLRGCINDAYTMQELLSKQGFTEIEMCLESAATTAGIMAALERLVAGTKAGDVIVFHYSGHGSQMYSSLEPDFMDEIICPIDLDWVTKVIRDDDLKRVFNKAPVGVNVTVILDCCHSGNGMDQDEQADFGYVGVARSEPLIVEGDRFMPMPDEMAAEITANRMKIREFDTSRDINNSALLIAGCDYYQTSADAYIGGIYQGAATYALNRIVNEFPGITYFDLVKKMNEFMELEKFTQRPQLDGAPVLYQQPFLAPWPGTTVYPPVAPVTGEGTPAVPADEKDNTMQKVLAIAGALLLIGLLIAS